VSGAARAIGGRQAIVHIGHKKTGTSFIQRQFHHHRAALLEQGLLYPLREPNHSFALSGLFKRHNIAKAPSPIDRYVGSEEKALAAFDAELAAADWTHLMLSAESLSGFSRAELANLRDWLGRHVETVRIVFVVRDPVDWAVSVAQQYLKTRGDVETVLAEPEAVQWRKIITRCRQTFGKAAVTVLEYEALALDRVRFAADFALAVGLSEGVAAPLCTAGDTVNESMSMEAALMLGRYNARVPQRVGDARNPGRSGTEPRIFAGLPGARFDLPDAARRKAYAQSRDDVAFLAREFGIKRYSYPASEVGASRYSQAVSTEFLDALADRIVAINASDTGARMLLHAQRLRLKGDAAGADATVRNAAHRFPLDRRVARELARLEKAVR
jgi:hypothetical protein